MSEKIRHQTLANFLGAFCLVLGLCVILGWISHSLLMIQINPRFSPMQFNTALCFALSSIAFLLLNNHKNRWSYLPTIIVGIIAGITLIEYFFNLNFGIDQLFIKSYLSTAAQYPGRMAPNAALAFSCISINLFILAFAYSPKFNWLYLFSFFLILSVGILSFIGYFSDFTLHYGIGQWIKISLHTAIGLICLSLALIFYIYSKRKHNYIPLAPLIVTFILFNTAFLGWQSIKKNQDIYFNIFLNIKINSISDIINTHIDERVSSFSRITYRWLNRKNTPEIEWREDIRHYIHDQSGYSAIAWMDKNYKVNWVEPQVGNELSQNYNYTDNADLLNTIKQSIQQKTSLISKPIELQPHEESILIFSPIIKEHVFNGFMLGIIKSQVMLENIISKTDFKDYSLKVYDGQQILYVNNNPNDKYYANWSKSKEIEVYGQTWKIVLWPSINLYQEMMPSFLSTIVLFIGFIIALLSGFLVQSIQLIKRNSNKLNIAQVELANAHERLRGMIEGSSGLVAAIDLNYNFIAFNNLYKSEIYRIFRINLTIGMNFSVLLNLMTHENRKKVIGYWTKAMKGDSFTVEESFDDKHHKGLCYEIHYNPIRDSHNKLIGASHMATNIYQRKQDEIVIANSKRDLELLVRNLEQQNRELELLKELMSLLQSSITLEDAVETIGSYAKRILANTSGIIYLSADNDNPIVKKVLSWGVPVANTIDFTTNECLALLRHQPYHIHNSEDNVLCNHLKRSENKPVSYACLPLFSQNVTLGLLYVEMEYDNSNNQRLIALAQIISEQIALSLYNIKMRDILRTQSIHDSLTGLYNRRFFEEYVNKEIQKMKRNPGTFAILLLDVDLFKVINDSHGHLVGDRVLCDIALKLQDNCRQSDLIARWGGEEFIIFLRETSLESAQQRAENIRLSIEQLSITVNELVLPTITISIGLSFYPYNGETIEALVMKADEALYQAKAEGRNRVVTNYRT